MSSRGADCAWANQGLASPVNTKKSATPCRTTCSRLIGTLRRLCCIRFIKKKGRPKQVEDRGTPSAPSPACGARPARSAARSTPSVRTSVPIRLIAGDSRRQVLKVEREVEQAEREGRIGEPLEPHDVDRHRPSSRARRSRGLHALTAPAPSRSAAPGRRPTRSRSRRRRRHRGGRACASASATTPAVTPEPQEATTGLPVSTPAPGEDRAQLRPRPSACRRG